MAIIRPVNLQKPFADAGAKNTIPVDSQIGIDSGAASYTDGFPPLTRTPVAAGGIPPKGTDMNGILFELSAHTVFQNAGGQYRFDAALATEIGGYPVGVVLQNDAGTSSYVNILAGNSTDFNTTPAAIGVSWLPYAGLDSAQIMRGTQVYSTAGVQNWVVPAGVTKAWVTVIGGGGGGGGVLAGGSSSGGAGGGGGGGGSRKLVDLIGVSTVAVTVGAGGIGGQLANGWSGSTGSASSFATYCSANAGVGGVGTGSTVTPTAYSGGGGGTGTGGDINVRGGPGGDGTIIQSTASSGCYGGNGGGSAFLGGGFDGGASGQGGNGSSPGEGGAGAAAGNGGVFKGGDGAPGIVIIQW